MLPTPELIKRLDEMYELTQKNGKEYIIAVGERGTISNIYEGEIDRITDGVKNAIAEIGKNGELISHIIHTHTEVLGGSTAVASENDRTNFIGKNNGIVLGIDSPPKNDSGGYNINQSGSSAKKEESQKILMINIYNRNNVYDTKNAVDYDTFQKAALKIYENIYKK